MTDEVYQSYDLILTGEIINIHEGKSDKTLVVRVKTVYKGQTGEEILEINTPARPGFCGLNAGLGDQWLFFAFLDDKRFSTSICTRTKNLEQDNHMYNHQKEEIRNDLIFLEAKLPLKE